MQRQGCSCCKSSKQRKRKNSQKLPPLLSFISFPNTLILVVLLLDSSGSFSLLCVCIQLYIRIMHDSCFCPQLQVSFAVPFRCSWHILCVHLPFFLLLPSSGSLFVPVQQCVCESVCMSVAGQLDSWLWLRGCALI